jgi:hypothetical protein
MAHFAKIENNTVTQVVVVDNSQEAEGMSFLNSIGLDGEWIQTSYTSSIRGKFAAEGDTYDRENDVFIPRKPFESWTWNEQNGTWESPTPFPQGPEANGSFEWSEETLTWEEEPNAETV